LDNSFKINVIHRDGSKDCLGHMAEKDVAHNRYNQGLLIAAGKLLGSDAEKDAFLHHANIYKNKAELEFSNGEKAFQGTFHIVNFIPESHTVVFGSTGTVYEWCPERERLLPGTEFLESAPETAAGRLPVEQAAIQ
jgi:hypothetical protein